MALPDESVYVVHLNYNEGRYYTFMPSEGFWPFVKCQIWGAGGGAGGTESTYLGGTGAGGGYVEGFFSVNPGEQIEVFVGQGGGGGYPGINGLGSGAGGSNGKSLVGYEGGEGGSGGPLLHAGGGGGGGGSTVLVINCKPVAIAGGGAGGGGASISSAGVNAVRRINPSVKVNLTMFDQGKGQAGQNNPYRGGGGGGGGGGISGGGGGIYSSRDTLGGEPGNCGTNGIQNVDPSISGEYCSGMNPGGYTVGEYPGNNVAVGGTPDRAGQGNDGGHGYAILTFYRTSEIFVKNNGVYKRINPEIRLRGSWGRRITAWVKVDGVWKSLSSTATVEFNENNFKWGGTGLTYQGTYPTPTISQSSYSIWGYYDLSTGCYLDDGNFYADFRSIR